MNGGHTNGDHQNGWNNCRDHPVVRQFPPTLPLPINSSPSKGPTIKDSNYWQSTAATNQRLLHVLSDLVKAFIDTESEIQSNLEKLGFINGQENGHDDDVNGSNGTLKVPKDDDVLSSLEDAMTNANDRPNGNCSSSSPADGVNGHKVVSHVTKRSKRRMNNDDVHVEFADDGPDLIQPTSFSFSIGSDMSPSDISQLSIDDDVVLGASRRLRTAVDRILNLLRAVATLQLPNNGSIESSSVELDNGGGRNVPKSATADTESDLAKKLQKELNDNEKVMKQLERELKESKKYNQVLQEEVNNKHKQLSSLKARIDSTNILDARSLKDTNDQLRLINEQLMKNNNELKEQLTDAESKVEKFAFAINTLREELNEKCQELERIKSGQCLSGQLSSGFLHNSYRSMEAVRDGSAFDHMQNISPLTDKTIKPFEGDTCDISDDDADVQSDSDGNCEQQYNGHHDESHSLTSSVFNPADLTKLYKKIVEDKNQEILILKEQMKLASNMIASAFPGHGTNSDDPVLDVDLIEELVDFHIRRHDHNYSDPDHGDDHLQRAVGGHRDTSPKEYKSASVSPIRRPVSECSSVTCYRGCEGPRKEFVSAGVNTSSVSCDRSPKTGKIVSLPKELEELLDDGDFDSWSESQMSNNESSYVDVQNLDTKLGQLHACVEKLIKSNNQLKSEIKREKRERETLTKNFETLKSDNQILLHDNETLAKGAKITEEEYKTLLEEKETLIEGMRKERQKHSSNDKIIGNLRSINESLEQRLKQINADYESLSSRKDSILSDNETLKKKMEEMSRTNDTLTRTNETLRREKDALTRRSQSEESVSNLKSHLNEQKKTINAYQDKIHELISKIDSLESDKDLKCYYESKVKELKLKCEEYELNKVRIERQLDEKQVSINQLKEQIITIKNDQINNLNCCTNCRHSTGTVPKVLGHRESPSSSSSSGIRHRTQKSPGDTVGHQPPTTHLTDSCQTIKKLKKVEHDLRALIYQKKYLLNLLGGFQLTERATLALIANMNISIDESLTYHSPLNRFRSIVFVCISLTRMKLLAKRRKRQFKELPATTHSSPMANSGQRELSIGHRDISRRKSSNSMTSTPKPKDDHRSRKSSASSTASSVSKYHDIKVSIDQNKSLEEFAERLEKLSEKANFVRDQRRHQLD